MGKAKKAAAKEEPEEEKHEEQEEQEIDYGKWGKTLTDDTKLHDTDEINLRRSGPEGQPPPGVRTGYWKKVYNRANDKMDLKKHEGLFPSMNKKEARLAGITADAALAELLDDLTKANSEGQGDEVYRMACLRMTRENLPDDFFTFLGQRGWFIHRESESKWIAWNVRHFYCDRWML